MKEASKNPASASALGKFASGEGMLKSALGALNVAVEAYPELKANQNISDLTEELTSTENRVSYSRQAFNDAVMQFNVYRQSFPNNFFAPTFGFRSDASLLEFEDSAQIQQAPKVSF
ncbi:hypothetical protein A3767_30665 [Oleiphilus sp. HI0133]|nr:hypothetical protein A3767_30665 [Oleiphilus sp. HI0133]